ncbi:MAG TPA: hypothetical protein VIT44_07070 [Cyclobacteriaceae bacterium]
MTNRLNEQEKEAFEKQLESDPALKADVSLQQQILHGVKNARVAELKSMLNKVPVNTGYTVEFVVARLAAGLVGAGVIGAVIYFSLKPEQVPNLSDAAADLSKKSGQVEPKKEEPVQTVTEPEEKTTAPAEAEEKEIPELQKNSPSELKQPKIEAIDPSEEMAENENAPAVSESHKGAISVSHIAVETDTANKNYDFHYQFASGKLFLYGPFDKSVYEILEINTGNHAMFLFLKDNYYLLDEKQLKITRLEPIKDPTLIRKLREYRSK